MLHWQIGSVGIWWIKKDKIPWDQFLAQGWRWGPQQTKDN